jgi:hypothetical protein
MAPCTFRSDSRFRGYAFSLIFNEMQAVSATSFLSFGAFIAFSGLDFHRTRIRNMLAGHITHS